MRFLKFLLFPLIVLFVNSCTDKNLGREGEVLKGTNTVIVGIYIDKNGYPQATVDRVNVTPTQKIVFAGPEKFSIVFKDQKSPIGQLEVESESGIVQIEIPRDIFERNRASTTGVDVKELVYRYGIRANGKLTDPTIHISPGSQ